MEDKSLQIAAQRGQIARQEFGAQQSQTASETAMAAVTAREQALIQSEYIMAERHPRRWPDVRQAMLDHCSRPRFAEVARYAKPVGRAKVNGEWQEQYARGFSARFSEVLAQEMGNLRPWSQVTYEDDILRIVRFAVTDLQKNLTRVREVTFAKATEKRGRQDKKTGEWAPPDGREVISERINTRGEPVYLVKATEDEMRQKVNSEESKTQRDFIQRLCPRDILEDCEDCIADVQAKADATDPLAARKKILDAFHRDLNLMPSDLESYSGRPADKWTPADVRELRGLYVAIRDGQTSFDEALKAKYAAPEGEGGSAAEAEKVAAAKIAEAERKPVRQPATPSAPPANSAPAGADTGTGNPPAPALQEFAAWGDMPDQVAESLGLSVRVAGILYTRQTTDQTWTRANGEDKPKAKPIFGRKG